MREFHLISAPFSCGISWLVSVLLELGVRTTHAEPKRYPRGFWERVEGREGSERMVAEGVQHMRFYLPRLAARNEFELERGLEVFWEHRLDFARQIHRPTILFVRDPRDAIHSLYLRNYLPTPWLDHLKHPEDWKDHFPGMFGLPPAETWAAWHAMWVGLKHLTPTLVLRFEDSRTDPVGTVRRALEFLGTSRSEKRIQEAVANSTFQRTKETMERAEKESGQVFRVARRGKVDEWREVFDDAAHALFGGPAAEWMEAFGYTPAPAASAAWQPDATTFRRELPSGVAEALRRAGGAALRGDVTAAKAEVKQAMAAAQGNEYARTKVGIEWVVLDWTAKVLGDAGIDSPAGRAVEQAFRDFLIRYHTWEPVQQMIQRVVAGVAPVNSTAFGRLDFSPVDRAQSRTGAAPVPVAPPVLIEENFLGYDLYGYRARFYAVLRQGAPSDWSSLDATQLAGLARQGTVLTADLSFELKESIESRRRA